MIEKLLPPNAKLVEAVRVIEKSIRRIAVVVDEERKLLGTVTDGDIRRALLAGETLETEVSKAMNPHPLTAPELSAEGHILNLMKNGNVLAIPIVDERSRFVRIVHLRDLCPSEFEQVSSGFEFAVIMAGGEGMRLRPITEKIPKPMVDIGGVPLLQRQITRLKKAGIRKIYFSVNYLSHVIEDYLKDGSELGIEICYLREKKKMGTGGALSLLPERPQRPILVMNGDVLTTFNFSSLFQFHLKQGVELTVAAIDYHIKIPFGVIQAEGSCVLDLVEKPSQRFLCNAGIYSLSPEILQRVPADSYYNMTDLMNDCLKVGKPVSVFPIHEYWSDIGTPAELDQARNFFSQNEALT